MSWQTGESTLEVFQISSASGFVRLGGMGMTDELDLDDCLVKYFGYVEGPELERLRAQVANDPVWQRDILSSCRYGHVFRRGLFRDDFVYGISNTGIYVYDITEMAAGAVSSLSLPAEVYANGGYGGGISGGGATPPSMGSPPPIQIDPGLPSPPMPASGGAAGAGNAGSSAAGTGGASAGMEEPEKAE
jgi:hypothetical protein